MWHDEPTACPLEHELRCRHHDCVGCVRSNWARVSWFDVAPVAGLDPGFLELQGTGVADCCAQLFVGSSPAGCPLVIEGEHLSERQAGYGPREVRLGDLDDIVDDPSLADASPGLESGDRGEGDHGGGTFVIFGRICGCADAAFG